MKKIAMFLGAGASKAFKYPLTSEILKLIIEQLKQKKIFTGLDVSASRAGLYRMMLEKLFIALSPGLEGYINSNKDIIDEQFPIITDLLSQAEHFSSNAQTLLDWNNEVQHTLLKVNGINERWELKDVIVLLDWAIIDVINKEGKITRDKLENFISWVKALNSSGKVFVSIITSNYDFGVEWNLYNNEDVLNTHKNVDYGFNWRDVEDGEIYLRPAAPKFRIFKLHGSIDWLKCERCGFIYINPLYDIYDNAFSNEKKPENSCHCDFWPLKPILVTPSFSRTVKDTNLSQIWRNALEELRLADEWVIAGYSLPTEDLDIKSLFIRALIGRKKPPVIRVVQQSNRSQARYDFFFGEGKYQFIGGGLEYYDFEQIYKTKKQTVPGTRKPPRKKKK